MDDLVLAALRDLPVSALRADAELAVMLETAPWSGPPLRPRLPDRNMRAVAFGEQGEGLAVYVILDDSRRVVVVRAPGSANPS